MFLNLIYSSGPHIFRRYLLVRTPYLYHLLVRTPYLYHLLVRTPYLAQRQDLEASTYFSRGLYSKSRDCEERSFTRRLAFLTSLINAIVGNKVYVISVRLFRGPRNTSLVKDISISRSRSSVRASSTCRALFEARSERCVPLSRRMVLIRKL